jgi:peroxiredoxin
MKKFAKINNFKFPYLYDETQNIAQNFGAVCTPDFFGYNKNNKLQYRGRFTEIKNLKPVLDEKNDLLNAMELIAKTSNGPKKQFPSMGCNIKWKR